MSREQLWNRVAEEMKADPDPRWQAVGEWLRAEAWTQEAMEPTVDLFNAAFEQKSGIKSYLRFKRNESGDLTFSTDTNEAATAVAMAYLDGRPDTTPPTTEGNRDE